MRRELLLAIGLVAGLAGFAAEVVAAPAGPDHCAVWDFSLRSDFNDLGPLFCPTPVNHAQGATASLTYNALTGQNSASLDGLAAITFRYFSPDFSDVLRGVAVGPFVQGDYTYQFQPTPTQSNSSNTLTIGAFTQILVKDPLFPRAGQDLFRVRGGEVDGSTGTYYTTLVGEWIPEWGEVLPHLFIGRETRLPSTPILYAFAPELMIQYDHLNGGPNKYLLFASTNEDLRIGPEAVLQGWINPEWIPVTIDKPIRDFLGSTSALITFHESWDEYTGRNYSWTAVSLTYTFSALSAHFGISASYGYGNSETTGNLTNQVKLGLAAKF